MLYQLSRCCAWRGWSSFEAQVSPSRLAFCCRALSRKQQQKIINWRVTTSTNKYFLKGASNFHTTTHGSKESKEEGKWVPAYPDLRTRIGYYLRLSKARLSGLVVLSAMAGYAIAPDPFSLVTFSCLSVGTALCSGAANSFNQFIEVPYDSQMSRTKNRVLVLGLLQPKDAFLFASVSSLTGISILFLGVNSLTAVLGALNIFLYAGVYTPSKRWSIANTWIGSIVGGIPPLMGWAAATGTLGAGAWVLAGMLYCWQFPHFNALSWSYRPDYSRAGYRMMAVTDPALCRRVTLRHSAAQIPLAFMLPVLDVTNWWFFLEATPLNLYLTYLSWKFYKDSNNQSSRKLFRFSLIHLPVLMLLAFVNTKRQNDNSNEQPSVNGEIA